MNMEWTSRNDCSSFDWIGLADDAGGFLLIGLLEHKATFYLSPSLLLILLINFNFAGRFLHLEVVSEL